MNLLKNLFTEHLLAKFFALFFAGATVYLIDRELTTNWVPGDVPLPVFEGSAAPGSREREIRRIELVVDPGVVVVNYPKSIQLTVVGLKQKQAEFDANPIIRLPVKLEWAERDIPVTRVQPLTSGDFRVDPEAVVTLGGVEPSIEVDLIKTIKVTQPVLAPPLRLEPGLRYDPDGNRFTRDAIELSGPRSVIAELQRDPSVELLEIEESKNVLGRGQYQLRLTAQWRDRRVLLRTAVKVELGVAEEERKRLVVTNVPVSLNLHYKNALAMENDEVKLSAEINWQCDEITFEGRAEDVGRWEGRERLEQLRQQLRVFVDPNSQIQETLSGDEFNTRLVIQIDGVPKELKLRSYSPRDVPVKIRRKN